MSAAASTVGTLWLSYVFFLFYCLLAVAGVTARTMFLEDRVTLPFPTVEIPLLAFFWVGPVMVLLAHVYILHQLIMLATKTYAYCEAYERTAPSDDPYQDLLPPMLFVRLIVGVPFPDPLAARILGGIVAWATVVIVPLLTLMFFEAQFLPFHSEFTTWWARAAVLVDVAMLWWLWPLASLPYLPLTRFWKLNRRFWMGFLSFFAIYMTIFVATFPTETIAEHLFVFPLHETLVGGKDDLGNHAQTIFPNRLFLTGIDLVDHKVYDTAAKIAIALPGHSLRGRHLERAVLKEAQLGRMDFVGAHLAGANLIRVRARGAWFDGADLSGAQLDDAELQGASFYKATMIGATLGGTQLQGARIAGADLRAAWLTGAELDGASLAGSDLRRATLEDASLTGVSFKEVKLQAASLAGTHLDGASLYRAELWKTDFRGVKGHNGAVREKFAPITDAKCPGWAGAADCVEAAQQIKTLIEHLIPDEWKRARMIERLLLPLADEHEEIWEKDSMAHFDAIKTVPLSNEDDVKLWIQIACIGKAAPFGISMLVDTYRENTGWTRPRDGGAVGKLITDLQAKGCAASLALSDDLRLGLADLPGAIAAEPPQ